MPSHPAPQLIFDEAKVSALILQWQNTGDEQLFAQIIQESLELIRCMIRMSTALDYEELDALTNECVLKLSEALSQFQTELGRAFSFCSVTLRNFLSSRTTRIRTYQKNDCLMSEEDLQNYVSEFSDPGGKLHEFWPLLQKLQTRFHEPPLLEIQRRRLLRLHRMVSSIRSKRKRCQRNHPQSNNTFRALPIWW